MNNALKKGHDAQRARLEAQDGDLLAVNKQRMDLQQSFEKQTAAFEALEAQNEELGAAMGHLEAENGALRAETHAALEARDAAGRQLKRAERISSESMLQVEKHQGAVAKLTADNLMFLTKFKDLEEELRGLAAEKEELETQRGPWFDRVRADVREQISTYMQKVIKLEDTIDLMEDSHARQLAGRDERLAAQREELEALQAEAKGLGEEIGLLNLKEKTQDLKVREATTSNQRLAARVADLESENRALLTSVRIAQGEIAQKEIDKRELGQQLAERADALDQTAAELADAKQKKQEVQAELHTQIQMNSEVMLRKQEMEWKLIKALTEAGARAGEGPGPAAPPAAPPGAAAAGGLADLEVTSVDSGSEEAADRESTPEPMHSPVLPLFWSAGHEHQD